MQRLLSISAVGIALFAMPLKANAWFSTSSQEGTALTVGYEGPDWITSATDESTSNNPAAVESTELTISPNVLTRYTVDLTSEKEPGPPESAETDAVPVLDHSTTMASLDLNVPTVRNAKIERHVQFFSYHIRDRFEQWLSRLERYRPTVQNIFSEFKLPLDLVFLSLVESGFNTNAVSRAKAVGPWQFMSATAKNYGLRVDSWVDERRDPVKSTIAAAQYLRDLYHMFGSWPLAMAAYNAGEGKVGRSLARIEDGDFWALLDTRLLRAETKEYVPRFVAAMQIAKDPGRFGFNIRPQDPLQYEEVAITRPVHLRAAAKAAGVSFEEMKSLNPELRRDITPPDPLYILRVPAGKKADVLAKLPTYQTIYPAVYHEPKRSLFQARGKETLPHARLSAQHRKHKSTDWLSKSKPGRGKPQVLAKASR